MIEIDDKIVSLDILRERFACDPSACKGACCVEGDAGAPLESDEIDILEEEYPNYAPYMTAEGREEIERSGFMVVDTDGDYTTPLVDNAQCAYSFVENGITYLRDRASLPRGAHLVRQTRLVPPISDKGHALFERLDRAQLPPLEDMRVGMRLRTTPRCAALHSSARAYRQTIRRGVL